LTGVRRVNVFSAEYEYDPEDPDEYRSGVARVGKPLGAESIAIKAFELPPGMSICPYHYEYEEEWLIVLEGTVIVRTPEGEEPASPGDAVRFPAGPAGAHKVTNRGSDRARVVMFSSSREPAVAVYPDSDKIGVWPGDDGDRVMLRREDGQRDYWDREP
jgi:uncharacterized cupin superfamily protein